MTPGYPIVRPRRLRANPLVRDMVRETTLDVRDFILPLFVRPGKNIRQEISSMPGNAQLSVDRLIDEVGAAKELGIRAFILFGIPDFEGCDRLERSARRGHRATSVAGVAFDVQERDRSAHRRVLLRIHRSRALRPAVRSEWPRRCR